jgi:hypothetical protein
VKSGLSLEHRDLRNVSNTLGGRSGAVDQIHHRGIGDSVACSWKRNTLRHGWCLRVVSASLSAEMNWLLSSLHSVAALHGTRLPNEGCFGVHVLKSIPGPECKTIFQILSKADLTYRNVSVLPVTAEIHRRTMPAANPATDWSLAPSSPRGLRGGDILRSRARIRCTSPLVAGTTS